MERKAFFLKKEAKTFCVLVLFAGGASAAETNVLHYTARLHGVKLLDLTLCIEVGEAAYRAGITARTLGLAEFLVHGRAAGHVEGSLNGAMIKPKTYAENSRLSGETYTATIDYPNGDPVLRTETPPQEKYRLPVPVADLHGAIDGLSAVTLEALIATRTGACQGQALVYDGRQLRRGITHTAGRDVLAADPQSIFSGPALRCDTESIMLAGFLKDSPVKKQARPHHSSSWLAPALPGGPDVPVRVVFDADFVGDIIVDLDAASHTVTPACGFAGQDGTR
jgi:hypothetical protein